MSTLSLMKRAARRAFSLTEIALGLLLISILILILLFSFNGLRARSEDTVAQGSLRTALTAAKGVAAGAGDSYSGATATQLNLEEKNLTFLAGTAITSDDTNVHREVSVASTNDGFTAVAYGNNTCWFVYDSVTNGTTYGVQRGVTTCAVPAVPLSGTSATSTASFPSR